MMKRSLTLVPLLVLLSTDYAVATPPKPECPTYGKRLADLCMFVNGLAQDTSGGYLHEQNLYEAACVLPTDSLQEKRRKVQKVWNEFEDRLICNTPAENIIKYAVERRFSRFLTDVARKWQVNLNRVDGPNNNTVLDHVQDQRDDYPEGSGARATLQNYYNTLRQYGAKHRSELFGPDYGSEPWVDIVQARQSTSKPSQLEVAVTNNRAAGARFTGTMELALLNDRGCRVDTAPITKAVSPFSVPPRQTRTLGIPLPGSLTTGSYLVHLQLEYDDGAASNWVRVSAGGAEWAPPCYGEE